jgi:t-SNARE complex subunit (syntaxin)
VKPLIADGVVAVTRRPECIKEMTRIIGAIDKALSRSQDEALKTIRLTAAFSILQNEYARYASIRIRLYFQIVPSDAPGSCLQQAIETQSGNRYTSDLVLLSRSKIALRQLNNGRNNFLKVHGRDVNTKEICGPQFSS